MLWRLARPERADIVILVEWVPFQSVANMYVLSVTTLFIAFGLSELGLLLLKRSGKAAQSEDRGSLGLLWIVAGSAIFLALYAMAAWPQFGYALSIAGYWSGIALFLLGVALRWWAIVHLGRFFTVNVAIAQDHHVVSDGPYRFVRHPSYAGSLLAFIGLGLLLHNWLAALLLLVPVVPAFLWRVKLEEHALSSALGAEYTEYMRHTRRIVPFVF